MALRRFAAIALTAWVVCTVIVTAPLAYDQIQRRQLEQQARLGLVAEQAALYTSPAVVVIKMTDPQFSVDLQVYDCGYGSVDIIYGTDRPPSDIAADYHAGLLATGWELDPGYRQSEGYYYYRRGPEQQLALDFIQPKPDVSSAAYATVFTIHLSYTFPAYHGCRG